MTVADPKIMQAVEQLGYRVTVGDIATQAGLNVNLAERGLLALASEAGGHLQVAESGEIAYQFPRHFRAVLRNKYWRLRLQEWWEKVWRVLFYLIRISFGIFLVLSILAILVAISVIVISISASGGGDSGGNNRNRSSGGGFMFFPSYWISDLIWFFNPRYSRRGYYPTQRSPRRKSADNPDSMSFLESVYSFLFGDGNPNANLEERRWQDIATIIRNHQGLVVAEQIAPYLDDLSQGYSNEYEEYMLPVLTRFNGRPEVSEQGGLVYHFPELQTTATQRKVQAVPEYLREFRWRFSQASSGQIMLAVGLGAVNLIGALVLGSLLADGAIAAEIGGYIAFVQSIYGVLLGYGIAFLLVPLIRYFWNGWRNRKIDTRNQQREARATLLQSPNPALEQKLEYARQFAAEHIISSDNLAYTTETDLLDQEVARSDQTDAEWQRRLSERNSEREGGIES
uniref:Uncharacterized protein n=1 Tax=Desertifilum tharense IPPAS B-1220 TaxID=1781255 RepID=A0ACD5GS20_9CYAN